MRLDPVLLTNRMPVVESALDRLAPEEREPTCLELLDAMTDEARPLVERISAGNAAGLLGDPRIDALRPRMCAVPYGAFRMGVDESEVPSLARHYGLPEAWFMKSTPQHEVVVDAFEIAAYPVTEGEYARFLAETQVDEAPAHWPGGCAPAYRRTHPVHGVSWQGALLYAEWVSQCTGLHYRLPTECEWEKAARGSDLRSFPWGNDFDVRRCNTRECGIGNTTPVGMFASGAAACGAFDMAGNVEEYVADLLWPYPGTRHGDPDYGADRVTRGGVFSLDADLARCDRRHGTRFAGATGFRLARSAADEWLGRDVPPG